MKAWIDEWAKTRTLPEAALRTLIESPDDADAAYLLRRARETREAVYGKEIFARGLIECTNVCKNDCRYCGIRRSNAHVCRYRLTENEILACCDTGYALGLRTFVLQGGEDGFFTDERLCGIVRQIKDRYPDAAVTLSLGERSRESYARLKAAGADRYLLRHETADPAHYALLHPPEMSFENRMRCLADLKALGYAAGCGMMVGSPGQTAQALCKDLLFIRDFQPEMIGIGPFLPQRDTPFGSCPPGSASQTLRLLALARLICPKALIPATTALGTACADGFVQGILAGANVVMFNLSPESARRAYALYDGKTGAGDEAATRLEGFKEQLRGIGCYVTANRGDSAKEAIS